MSMRPFLRTAIIVSLFFVAITAVFFSRALFSADQFFFGDVSQNHYPARKLITSLESEGNFPLWNPYLSSGQPLYANPNNLIFHPVSLLSLVLPFEEAFKYSIILQYLLCAAGMYLFSREMGLSIHASVLSSSLFTFSGFFLSLGHLYNLLCAAAWIPLFLFFFSRSIRRSRMYAVAASLVLVIILLGAEPFFIVATMMLTVALFFLQRREGKEKGALVRDFRTLLLVVLTGVLLSSFLLLPALEMFMYSERGSGLTSDVVSRWSLTPMEILGIFIPDIFGDPLSLSISEYWGGFFFKESLPLFLSLYMGIPALLLAGFGFLKMDRRTIVFLILFVSGLFLALGSNNLLLAIVSERLPFSSSLRYASKFFLISAFSLSILSGTGFDVISRISEERRNRAKVIIAAVPASITLFLMSVYYVGTFFPEGTSAIVRSILKVNGNMNGNLLFTIQGKMLSKIIYAAGVALIIEFLFLARIFGKIGKSVVSSIFILFVLMDLLIVNGDLNPVARPSFYARSSPFSATLQGESAFGRIYREKPPKDLKIKTNFGLKEEGFFWNRMVLLQWTGLPEKLSFAYDQNVDRLETYRSFLLMKTAKERGWKIMKRVFDISTVRYLILFEKNLDSDLSEIMEYSSRSNYPVILYKNMSAFPRFYAVPAVKIARTEEESLRLVLSDEFQPEKEAIVQERDSEMEELAGLRTIGGRADGDPFQAPLKSDQGSSHQVFDGLYSIKADELKTDSMRLIIDASVPGFLVVTDSFYPGWHCRVDGNLTPLFQANYISRGIPFSKGVHTVEFFFHPSIFFVGIAISSITFALMMAVFLVAVLRKRYVSQSESDRNRLRIHE